MLSTQHLILNVLDLFGIVCLYSLINASSCLWYGIALVFTSFLLYRELTNQSTSFRWLEAGVGYLLLIGWREACLVYEIYMEGAPETKHPLLNFMFMFSFCLTLGQVFLLKHARKGGLALTLTCVVQGFGLFLGESYPPQNQSLLMCYWLCKYGTFVLAIKEFIGTRALWLHSYCVHLNILRWTLLTSVAINNTGLLVLYKVFTGQRTLFFEPFVSFFVVLLIFGGGQSLRKLEENFNLGNFKIMLLFMLLGPCIFWVPALAFIVWLISVTPDLYSIVESLLPADAMNGLFKDLGSVAKK